MATIYQNLGQNIRKIRKKKGITQEKLTELAKIDPKSVIQIENGKRNLSLKTLKKISFALNLKPFELLQ